MEKMRILIVEDDIDLSGIMKDFLMNEGYEVTQIFDGDKAVDKAKEIEPTLILLDIMLPGMDGIQICRKIRSFSFCPIIIISAKSSDSDKLLSLGMGADDYLTKPFSLPEMVGRVKSHIRRFTAFGQPKQNETPNEAVMQFGKLIINPISYEVTVDGVPLKLTSREFKLLTFFASHPSQVFSKEQLLNNIWGTEEYVDDNTIAVYVGRLREKLTKVEAAYIKTVWGVGYKWEM